MNILNKNHIKQWININTLMIFLIFITSCTSCKKDPPLTPLDILNKYAPITQTGANTFGCLVNGEPAYTQLYWNQLAGEGAQYGDLATYYSKLYFKVITKNNNIRRDFYFCINPPPPL